MQAAGQMMALESPVYYRTGPWFFIFNLFSFIWWLYGTTPPHSPQLQATKIWASKSHLENGVVGGRENKILLLGLPNMLKTSK